MYSKNRIISKCFVSVSIVLVLFLSMGFADYDADGVDLIGRSPYGYSPFVIADGEYLYAANGTVLQVLDIHTLQPVGEWVTESIVSSLAVSDGYVFIANWSDGFKVIDVDDPTNPHMVAEIDFTGQCWDLSLNGNHAYLGNGDEGLRIIDISNPLLPTLASTFTPVEAAIFEYTQVIDTIAYSATQSGLYILDVSDPTTPVQLGQSLAENDAWSVHVVDTIAYLPKAYDGIRMVNVADPTNPIELGYFHTPDYATWISIQDTLAYVAERWSGIQVLDISDLTAPDSIGIIEMDFADAIHFQGDSMYVAASSWGVKSFDMSDPMNPTLLNENPMGGYSLDIVFSGEYVYASYRSYGIRAFQRLGDDSLAQVGQIELEAPNKLFVRGDRLFATDNGNLQIIDISDPTNLQLLNTWEEGTALGVTAYRNFVYLSGYPDLQILDVGDPLDIQVVSTLDGLPSSAYEIVLNGGFALLASRSGGLNIVDIRDPANPQHVSNFDGMSYFWSLDASGKYVYLVERNNNEIRAVDISNPEAPVDAGVYSNFSRLEDIKVFGRYVYALDSWDGVCIIDFGDPSNPQEVGYFNTGGYAKGLFLNYGEIAVADGGGGIFLLTTGLNAPTFVVNSVGDQSDNNPGDGICDDGSGDCTLRAAIEEANAYPGYNIIYFDIPGEGPHYIQPMTELPSVADPVDLNGRSEPDWSGSPVVSIQGDNAGEANGIFVTADGAFSRIFGLNISGFSIAGLRLEGSGHSVIWNYLGTDVTGGTARGNDFGIEVLGSYNRFTVNTISGNVAAGVNLIHIPDEGNACHHNNFYRNQIGTDPAGEFAIPNTETGIWVEGSWNHIGGTVPGDGNIISGNQGNGISLINSENKVVGNLIGLDATGTYAIGNGNAGIMINGPGNLVGGTSPETRNVISGNLEGVTFDGEDAQENVILGNYIGTDITGTTALGNGVGILLLSSNNFIGGGESGATNLISGNANAGINIGYSGAPQVAQGNIFQGNLIGTDHTGTSALPNASGFYIDESGFNNIGGSELGEGNLISGNTYSGIFITGQGAESNVIEGNCIGTNPAGTEAIPNLQYGIRIRSGASGTRIGGTVPGSGNLISGNLYDGIALGWDGGSSGNIIQGNLIGLGAGGILNLGNGRNGINLFGGAEANLIGGEDEGAANFIAFNGFNGVNLNSSNYEIENTISRNSIHSNVGVGIDLATNTSYPYTDGVTQNDPGDADDGPNHLQNFPESLNVGVDDGGDLLIQYVVDSEVENSEYPIRVEFFLSDEDGEGHLFLYSNFFTAENHDMGLKTIVLGPAVNYDLDLGNYVVATATDANGNTSEFSAPTLVSNYVGVAEWESVPTEFCLNQNYPNPFNPTTSIRYGLPEISDVSLVIYDLTGRVVRSYSESSQTAGWFNYEWSGTNMSGEPVGTGVYLCRLEAGNYTKTIKMVYLK